MKREGIVFCFMWIFTMQGAELAPRLRSLSCPPILNRLEIDEPKLNPSSPFRKLDCSFLHGTSLPYDFQKNSQITELIFACVEMRLAVKKISSQCDQRRAASEVRLVETDLSVLSSISENIQLLVAGLFGLWQNTMSDSEERRIGEIVLSVIRREDLEALLDYELFNTRSGRYNVRFR